MAPGRHAAQQTTRTGLTDVPCSPAGEAPRSASVAREEAPVEASRPDLFASVLPARGQAPGIGHFPCPGMSRRGILPLMGASPSGRPDDSEHLLAQAAAGDQQAWGTLLARHRDRLRAMIALRLDPRLQGRLDPSDVLQEAFLTASRQLKDYAGERSLPFFLWLRLVTGQKLVALHRHHLGKQLRDAGREVALYRGAGPEVSSTALAARLLG